MLESQDDSTDKLHVSRRDIPSDLYFSSLSNLTIKSSSNTYIVQN